MTPSDLRGLTERLLAAARAAGADAADAIATRAASVSVDAREGALEHAERSEAVEAGLRVLVGRGQACVSASGAEGGDVAEMAARAVAMAREAPEDPVAGLAEPGQLARGRDLAALETADPAPEPSAEALRSDALAAEAAAMEVAGVSRVQQATASYGARDVRLAASNGFSGGYRRTYRALGCVAIAGAGAGMERDHSGDERVFQSDLRGAREIGAEAGARAAERLGARKPPTGSYPVLFDERVSSTLIGHLLAAANGSRVARGSSWLRGMLGRRILPEGLDLVEDPRRPRAAGSRPFDAEGLPTARRAIVEDGVLAGWTLDLATGRRLGMASTANAARAPSGPPGPSNWNVALGAGAASRADLVRDMGTGLLVTSLMGSAVNPDTGDYSRGAAGMWVDGGAISHPVSECTIAGNLLDMLLRIVPADDARAHLERAVPSLLVPGMTVAGG